MVLHPDTVTAILKNWDAPKYDGSQEVRPWLRAIEELCRIYGIPPAQMTEMAVKCTDGEAKVVLMATYEARVAKAGVWSWADFKECVIYIEDTMIDAPQNIKDGDFRSQHPYASAALAATLIGVGVGVALPAVVMVGTIGCSAGSLAVALQSLIYAGFGTAAAGTWFIKTNRTREVAPAAES